ncbi:MAG: DUF6231 family protein [Pseudomonadota bacterium]
MNALIEQHVARALMRTSAASALLIGRDAPALAQICEAQLSQLDVTVCERVCEYQSSRRFDAAFLVGALEEMEKPDGKALVARLRDVDARYTCVAVPLSNIDSNGWSAADMLALGFKRVSNHGHHEQQAVIFDFSLHNYKATPRWLNKDNWANPEMWDKHRW